MERPSDLILDDGSSVSKMGIGEAPAPRMEVEDASIGVGEGMVVDGAPVSRIGAEDAPKIRGGDGVVHVAPASGMGVGDAKIGETEGISVDENGVKRNSCVAGGGLDDRQHRSGRGVGDEEEDRILDLTSCQLRNLEEVDLPSMLTELDLTANRLSELDPRIGTLSCLQKLSLEQNLFIDEAVHVLALWRPLHGLQELVLRDNKLLKIPPLSNFKNLTLVDVSFNKLTSLKGMSEVSLTLKELYVSNNEVGKIEEIEHLRSLRVLELGSNKIRAMEGLEQLAELQQLWLGRNRIQTVNLSGLTGLLQISLQSNRLTLMGAFQVCEKLTELYLSHNSISVMEGLSTLQNLRVLDLASNRITVISNLENLTRLEDLWLNDNQISSLEGIETLLQGCKDCLSTIYLERNPCVCSHTLHLELYPLCLSRLQRQRQDVKMTVKSMPLIVFLITFIVVWVLQASDPKYIFKLRSALPKLQQLDSHLLLH